MACLRNERGGVSILAVTIVCLLLSLAPALVDAGLLLTAKAEAESAADAAALAATQEFFLGGDPGEAAARYAAINGARLTGISQDTGSVTVTVEAAPRSFYIKRLGIAVPDVRATGKAELKDGVFEVL